MSNNQFLSDIPSSKHHSNNNDVSNTAPSVEEASTRFGVSLRKREPSTDSCSSLGSPANDLNDLSKIPYQINEIVPKIDPAALLVNELAETMHIPKPDAPIKPSDLGRKPSTAKQILSNVQNPIALPVELNNGKAFKAQLKKVEPKKVIKEPPKDEITTSIIDFKSRLRKVDPTESEINPDDINKISSKGDELTCNSNNNNKVKSNNNTNNNNNNNSVKEPLKKTEIKIDVVDDSKKRESNGEGKLVTVEEDDKRKSTGSISSLKKLWEAKELAAPSSDSQTNQLSPKMGNPKKKDEFNADDGNNNGQSESSSMDPPVAKKPAVPVKPSKFTIYATPNMQQHQQQQQQNTTKGADNNNHNVITNVMSSTNSSPPASRENILELVQMVECNLKIPVNFITATQWLQLSDKLNIIQSSCVTYADTLPLHTKFQFRELVTRVENQSNCLRTAGQKNIQDNEKLLNDVGQSLKQLSNALHR